MEDEGFQIHGITFDLGNNTLTSQLNYSKTHYFLNPNDKNRKVYMFPDVPHLIKLVRNHLFDHGFMVPSDNGDLVPLVKQDFWDVLFKNRGGSDLRTSFNLSQAHLTVKGSQRQRVRLAVQTLSSTVANSLLQFGPDTNEYKAKHKAVQLLNDWFDCMNSRRKYDKKMLSCAMSPDLHERDQFSILDQMEHFLKTFHVMNSDGSKKVAWQPWQHGMMCSIKSTRDLYKELVTDGPFEFLLTAKLNQDCLENLFSRLRALGGDNTHPSPLEIMNRMRLLLLMKKPDLLIVNKPAVEMEDDNGDPVSQEDIAEQELILSVERCSQEEIDDRNERIAAENDVEISSQVVTDDYDYTVEIGKTNEEIAKLFELEGEMMEEQEREEKRRNEEESKMKKEEDFVKDVQLLCIDTYFHSWNMHMDAVQFPTPVIIEEVRLIPKQQKIYTYPALRDPQAVVGFTNPKKFDLQLFCNDVNDPAACTFTDLGTLHYDENQNISLKIENNHVVTRSLVIQGSYENLTIAVYGRIAKRNDRVFQGLGYFDGFVIQKENKRNERKRGHTEERDENQGEPSSHGKKSGEYSLTQAQDSLAPWIFMISRQGLTVPYNDFLLDSELFEAEFNAYHGPFSQNPSTHDVLFGPEPKGKGDAKKERYFPFKRGTRIIDELTNILIAKFGHKTYDHTIFKTFARSRLNIRIKAQKMRLDEEKAKRLADNKKRRLTTRDQKQMGQLSGSNGRGRKQLGQFQN